MEILISTPMGYHGFNREKNPVKGHGDAVPILVQQLCVLESQFTQFPWIFVMTFLLYPSSSGASRNVSILKVL